MNRSEMLRRVADTSTPWDVLVIGGGATGLGTAVDAAARGYRTLLLEQGDLAQGTSSRSTKLIHGGVRYLKQGNLALVLDALHERDLLLKNAPHLVRHQAFIVPNYEWWEGPFYGIGLKIYDALAGKLGFGPSRHLSREETLEKIPTLSPDGLRGGTIYCDGQFDDARLAIALARTLAILDGCIVNYMPVIRLLKTTGCIRAVAARDEESGRTYEIPCRVAINAAGIFADTVRQMDDMSEAPLLKPSQGVHIVLDRKFLPGDTAIMVPHTDDGRVLFAVPWLGRVIVGTTDTPVDHPEVEPLPRREEIDFLVSHASRYLTAPPTTEDIRSVFAGIRPLVHGREGNTTAALSRDHHVVVSPSGLVTVAGGKWTTYRKMGEDAVSIASKVAGLEERPSETRELKLQGANHQPDPENPFDRYGSDGETVLHLVAADPGLGERIHPALPYRKIDIVWSVRYEMARTLTDVLSRRLRALVLDSRAALEMAVYTASVMAEELGEDPRWASRQVAQFQTLASRYLP
jgi:glycerol-3-phosphate dehydrogenase